MSKETARMSTGGRNTNRISSTSGSAPPAVTVGSSSSVASAPPLIVTADEIDITGRPLALVKPIHPKELTVIQTYGPRGGLLWYIVDYQQILTREGKKSKGHPFVCNTIKCIPVEKRPKNIDRCPTRDNFRHVHVNHPDDFINPDDFKNWFFLFLVRSFIAHHGQRLTNLQLKLIQDHFHMAVHHTFCEKFLFTSWDSACDQLVASGNPFSVELDKRIPSKIKIPLMALKIPDVAAALELSEVEFEFRYGLLADACNLQVHLGYRRFRGQALPNRNILYTRKFDPSGKYLNFSFLLFSSFLPPIRILQYPIRILLILASLIIINIIFNFPEPILVILKLWYGTPDPTAGPSITSSGVPPTPPATGPLLVQKSSPHDDSDDHNSASDSLNVPPLEEKKARKGKSLKKTPNRAPKVNPESTPCGRTRSKRPSAASSDIPSSKRNRPDTGSDEGNYNLSYLFGFQFLNNSSCFC